MIDDYCERIGSGLWGEPANALSNAAFLLAAWFLWRLFIQRHPQSNERSTELTWLIMLVAAIGIGSSLFHTFATRWAMWMDIIPIMFFQLSLIWLYMHRVMRLHLGLSLVLMLTFVVSNIFSRQYPELLNGSFMYFPALFSVLLLGIIHARQQQEEPYSLLYAFGMFCVSMTFRSLDEILCDSWPLGTHFLWHLLNGIVLYLATRAMILSIKTPALRP